ncbi:hypothetical protein ETD83_22640 [Actinomadura soli]|uniref:Uncharacterized protein n=1 Tax=Actinomadura soli TaxID=2508997 RepID=A0A5C4JAJ6_9ACTN|nr:hypothetical protein [Actinomadura soli]TMQ95288.1 hypothetical protein ETD83_22640 [Actinomadura soli]
MDYLKEHARASFPGLAIICRFLADQPGGIHEATLKELLHPLETPADSGSTFQACLAVGHDLGIIEDRERGWALHAAAQESVQRDRSPGARLIGSLILRRIGERAVEAIEQGERPSDLAVALTWFVSRDPLQPLPYGWSDGPEEAFEEAWPDKQGPVKAREQWRPFRRWAQALGLGFQTPVKRRASVLTIDPTRAVDAVLGELPPRSKADDWFRGLHSLLPVLGARPLVNVLPADEVSEWAVRPSVALAIRKLERARKLELIASDDSISAVSLQLGDSGYRIGEVRVMKGEHR